MMTDDVTLRLSIALNTPSLYSSLQESSTADLRELQKLVPSTLIVAEDSDH